MIARYWSAAREICAGVLLAAALGLLTSDRASAEIIFQDFFLQGAPSITNSVPAIDVQGQGWQLGPQQTPVDLDGHGHFLDSGTNGAAACVPLIPIGPHGSMTLTAALQLPTAPANWIGMGFANSTQVLVGAGSQSGPWLRVNSDGSLILYGGTETNNPLARSNAFVNTGVPVKFLLTYDAFTGSAMVATIGAGVTNVIINAHPVTNTLPAITARFLAFQFSAVSAPLSNRWVSDVALDWFPRPPPMLTLPVPPGPISSRMVGAPTGGDDTQIIQNALNFAATNGPTEVIFNSGATYIITNGSTVAQIPLTLTRATNVVINGNGCEILIKNPRIGFLHLQYCANVIVEGFAVDYDPLPYAQGIVTRNLYTAPPSPGAKEAAIEFRLDAAYPAPTNANYLDADAVASAERWGTIMDTNNPGRGADNRHTIYVYKNVVQTNVTGVFKVQFPGPASMQTIQSNDFWCMVSRWNGSSVYSAGSCYQITFLNLTDYAGAAANFEATSTALVNEINCTVAIGPPPAGASRGRIKSSNADGGYFGSSRIGPWVEGCKFTGLSDDVANAYTEPFVITNAPAEPTNVFSLWVYNTSAAGGPPSAYTTGELAVGDQLDFFNALTGVIFDQAIVTNLTGSSVAVDHAISGVVNGTYQTNTLVLDNSLNASAVYLNNQFSNSRIHGIYCRANNILIAHNSVSGMGLSAISGFPALDLGAPNSFVPTNAIILDNVLSDCSYSYESINNGIPTGEPAYALIELHQTRYTSDYVSNTFAMSGVRILNNAFLKWRRAPLSLHNVTDVNVIGNYFGPPIASDGLIPLSADVIADLWDCDYPNMRFTGNANATGISNSLAIFEDGVATPLVNVFSTLTSPLLALSVTDANAIVSWSSPAPGFVLQQTGSLLDKGNNWVDSTNSSFVEGSSNSVSFPQLPGSSQQFYRLRQR